MRQSSGKNRAAAANENGEHSVDEGSLRWRCVLQDTANHSAIPLAAVTKGGELITATKYAVCWQAPMPKRDYQLSRKGGRDVRGCVRVRACVLLGVIVKSLPVAVAKCSIHSNLQLHGQPPTPHTTTSTTSPQSPLSLCLLTSSLSP